MAFTTIHPQPERVIGCFLRYMEQEGHKVSRAEFEQNLSEKLDDPRFIADIGLLVIDDSRFDPPGRPNLRSSNWRPGSLVNRGKEKSDGRVIDRKAM